MARNQAIAAWYQRQTLLQSEEVGEPKAQKHHVSRGQWVSDSGEYLGIPSLWSLLFFLLESFFLGGRGNREIMRISIGFWVILFADKPKSWNQMGNFPHNYVSLVERNLQIISIHHPNSDKLTLLTVPKETNVIQTWKHGPDTIEDLANLGV